MGYFSSELNWVACHVFVLSFATILYHCHVPCQVDLCSFYIYIFLDYSLGYVASPTLQIRQGKTDLIYVRECYNTSAPRKVTYDM